MSSLNRLEKFSDQQGWDSRSQVFVLLEYIERQQSPEAFESFLLDFADWENQQTDSLVEAKDANDQK